MLEVTFNLACQHETRTIVILHPNLPECQIRGPQIRADREKKAPRSSRQEAAKREDAAI